jgi:hypothetical protein
MPTEIVADRAKTSAPPARAGRVLLVAGGLSLIGAGALMWWRNGAAIFTDTVLAALAWCF